MRDLSVRAKIYILIVIVAGVVLFGVNLPGLDINDLPILVGMGVLAAITLFLKVLGPTERSHYSINFIIYAFTFAFFGPSETMLVIVISNVIEWIYRKYPWYIQSFNIGAYLIVIAGSGIVYRLINPVSLLPSSLAILGFLAAMAAFTLLNHLMVGVVLWLARGENFITSGIFSVNSLAMDFIMLCMGIGSALIARPNLLGIIFIVLPLYLIYNALKIPALERQTEIDQKTGLYNLHYFERALKTELSRANRFDRPVTVVMADLDLLRNINNTYGHLAGDQVLIGIANILKQSVRDYDIVARFGGEEFSILMLETQPEEALSRIEDIRATIEKSEFSVQTSVNPIKVTVSFGLAGRDRFDQPPNEIIHHADLALYRAKLQGRNRAFVFSEETSSTSGDKESHTPSLSERVDEIHRQSFEESQPSNLRIPPEIVSQKVAPELQVKPRSQSDQSWSVYAFIGGMAVSSLVLFLILYKPGPFNLLELGFFILVVILTEWYSVEIYVRDTSVSTSAAPMLAGILLFGPVGALVLSLTFAVVALLKNRSRISRFIFNISNQLLAGLIYIGLFQVFKLSFSSQSQIVQLFLCMIAVMIVYLVTTASISFAMHLDMDIAANQVWKERFSWLVPYYAALGLIAFAVVFSYHSGGILDVGIFLVPLFLLRFSQDQYVKRSKILVDELKNKNTVLEKNSQEIVKLNESLLSTLANTIDLRDPPVLGHSRQVARYSVLIAQKLGLAEKQIENIRKAGLLHDIGKLGISEAILHKSTTLTADEYTVVKGHSVFGAELLQTVDSFHHLIPAIRHHHEHYDGNGYPDGLKFQNIPIEARILALADAVEAMASDRPYSKARSPLEIIDEVQRCSGTQFDPAVSNAFVELFKLQGETLFKITAKKA